MTRLFFHQLRTEQLLFWRSREAAFFTFLLPVIFFLLLGSVYGNDKIEHVKGSRYLLAGMLGYGVVATAFAGLAITLVIRREGGVLKRLRATPLPPGLYIASLLASTLVVYALEVILLLAIGAGLFGIGLPDRLGSLVVSLLIGSLAFAALGLGLTSVVRSAEGSSAVVNAIYLPMAFISGSFFSPHSFPQFLRAIADVLPLTYFIRLVRDVTLHGVPFWDRPTEIGVVAAWGAVGVLAAVRGFRWEPRES